MILSACVHRNTTDVMHKEVATDGLMFASREEVERKIGVNFGDLYTYFLNGNLLSGARYNDYVFIFKNDSLANIVEFSAAMDIWREEFIGFENDMPYRDNLPSIHKKLSALPLYAPRPRSNNSDNTNVSDGLAAGTMFILSLPIMPIILLESTKNPAGVQINWETVVGHSFGSVSSKLGDPIEQKVFKQGNRIVAYKQQYFWIPHYLGVNNEQVSWVLHKSFELNNYFGNKKNR